MPSPFNCNDCKDTGWIHVPDGSGCISKDLCDCGIYMQDIKKTKRIVTKVPHYKCAKFKIGMIIEYYKEYTVRANTIKEARELAEARARERNTALSRYGYNIGDIEIISAKEL